MAQQYINYGDFPDDGQSDSIREAFQKIQENFTELYNKPQSGVGSIIRGDGINLINSLGEESAVLSGEVTVQSNIAKLTFQAGDPSNPASLGAQLLTINGGTTATITNSNPIGVSDIIIDIAPSFLENFSVVNLDAHTFDANFIVAGSRSLVYTDARPPLTVIGGVSNNVPTGNVVADHFKVTEIGRFIGNVSIFDDYSGIQEGSIPYHVRSTNPYLAPNANIQILTVSSGNLFRYSPTEQMLYVPNVTVTGKYYGNFSGNITGTVSADIDITGNSNILLIHDGTTIVPTESSTGNIQYNKSTNKLIYNATGIRVVGANLGLEAASNLQLDATSSLYVGNTDASTSNTTGPARFAGGVSIAKNLNVGSNVNTDTLNVGNGTGTGSIAFFTVDTNGRVKTSNTSSVLTGSEATTGALRVDGGVSVGNNLYVGSEIASVNYSTGAVIVEGGVGIGNSLNVANGITANKLEIGNSVSGGTNTPAATITEDGKLYIANTDSSTGLAASYSIHTAGGLKTDRDIKVNGTTISTTPDTGALTVVGGVGIGGNLNVDGYISFGENALFDANSIVQIANTSESHGNYDGALIVKGGIGTGGNLSAYNGLRGEYLAIGNGAGRTGIESQMLYVGTDYNTTEISFISNKASATLNLFETNVSVIDAFTDMSALKIGKAASYTTLRSNTIYGANSTQWLFDSPITTTMMFAGNATQVYIGNTAGTMTLRNPTVVGTETTQNLWNDVATTVNFIGDADTINMGNANSTLTLRSNTVVGDTGQTTQNLWDDVATTVNFIGAADTINMGNANSTLTLRSNTVIGEVGQSEQYLWNARAKNVHAFGEATNMFVGTANSNLTLRSSTVVGDAGQTAQNLWYTIATLVNFAGAARTLNIADQVAGDQVLNLLKTSAGTQNANIMMATSSQNANMLITATGNQTLDFMKITSAGNTVANVLQTASGNQTANILGATGTQSIKIANTSAGNQTLTLLTASTSGNQTVNAISTLSGNQDLTIGTTGSGTLTANLFLSTGTQTVNAISTSGGSQTVDLVKTGTGTLTANAFVSTGQQTANVMRTSAGDQAVNMIQTTTSGSQTVNLIKTPSGSQTLDIAKTDSGTQTANLLVATGTQTVTAIKTGAAAQTLDVMIGGSTQQANVMLAASAQTGNLFSTGTSQTAKMLIAGTTQTADVGIAGGTQQVNSWITTSGTQTGTFFKNSGGGQQTLDWAQTTGSQTINIATTSTGTGVYNLFSGPTSSKTIGFGNGSGSSTTDFTIGSNAGTMLINTPTVVGSQTTQNLWDSNATTINFGGSATQINVGATTGTVLIDNPTVVGSQATQNLWDANATTINFGGAATQINVGATSGTVLIDNPTVVGSQSTQNLWDANATTINFGGAATQINMGATSGTVLIDNPTVVGSQATQNLWDSNASTINFGGAATQINMGATSGTVLIDNPTVVGSQATQYLWNSNASTINFGGAATQLNIGASSGYTKFNSTDDATSYTTGAVRIAGGISAEGQARFKGTIYSDQNIWAQQGFVSNAGAYSFGPSYQTSIASASGASPLAVYFNGGSYSPMSWTTSGDQGAVVMQYGAKIDGSGLYTDKITATSGTGTITGTWNLASGSKIQATYSDVAEYYAADADYEPGTVLVIGGEYEVTLANDHAPRTVIGVVTTEPAYVLNTANEYDHPVCIALTGRVPVRVRGTIRKGDLLVGDLQGYARASDDPKLGTVIGKALESHDGEQGVIEVMVGRC